jgi:hypothetical protein
MSKPTIVLVAGHNSVGDGGNPVERSLTPNLAVAYKKAFEDAGYPVVYVNPTLTPGGLSGLASATARAISSAKTPLVLALDLHFNGTRSAVHSIVAHNRRQDGRGQLESGFPAGRVAEDVAENNTLDMKLAAEISKEIANANGLSLWPATKAINGGDPATAPVGVMLENRTGVGDPNPPYPNSRLGMMGASAGLRMKAVRLTVEHGGTDDAKKPDFFNKCAQAALRAVNRVMDERNAGGGSGSQPDPQPDPEQPPKGDPGDPGLLTFLFGGVPGYSYDPTPGGIVSKLWRESGEKNGVWPRLIDVRVADGNKWFAFGDGSVIYVPRGGSPRYLISIKEDE